MGARLGGSRRRGMDFLADTRAEGPRTGAAPGRYCGARRGLDGRILTQPPCRGRRARGRRRPRPRSRRRRGGDPRRLVDLWPVRHGGPTPGRRRTRGADSPPESFTIDAYHSFPYFDTVHLGTSVIRGRFEKISGKLVLDTAAKTGTIELTVPTATLSTGDNDKGSRPRSRDEHLRSPDFFNVAEFPTMSYKGKATKFNGDAPATVEGQLTLLGVTKPVTLTVERWKCGPDPRTQGKRYFCGGNATGAVNGSYL